MNLSDALSELDTESVARFGVACATAALPYYQELLAKDQAPGEALKSAIALLEVTTMNTSDLDQAENGLSLAMERLREPSALSERDVAIADNVLGAISWACATVRSARLSPECAQFAAANAAMVAAMRSRQAVALWAVRPYLGSTAVFEEAYEDALLTCRRLQLLDVLELLQVVADPETVELVMALFDEAPGPLSELVEVAAACVH